MASHLHCRPIVGMLVELQGTPHLESGGCGTLHHGWSVDVGWTYNPDVGCGTTLDVGLEYSKTWLCGATACTKHLMWGYAHNRTVVLGHKNAENNGSG